MRSAGPSSSYSSTGRRRSTMGCRSIPILSGQAMGTMSRSWAGSHRRRGPASPSRPPRRLKIAAKVDPVDRPYFESEIQPLLDDPLIDYVGEIGDADKPRFLGEATALLFPIDWPEPFGLVVIEALACGTPVIARPCGSVPELITPGRTGVLADTLDEIVEALRGVDRLDRAQCRREAERRFSVERMVDDCDAVYESLATGAPLS